MEKFLYCPRKTDLFCRIQFFIMYNNHFSSLTSLNKAPVQLYPFLRGIFIKVSSSFSQMDNIVLLRKTPELFQLCQDLGFTETLFLDDVAVLEENNLEKFRKKALLEKQKGKFVIAKPRNEDMLRFILEKTAVDMVYGLEMIHPSDSVHYVRGSLDQVLCQIAAAKGKMIEFSFSSLLHSSDGKLLGRMKQTMKLCKKYKVKMFFGNFSTHPSELRSKKDLAAFQRVLEKEKK